MLLLFAALALPATLSAGGANTKSSFSYLNALIGSDRTDVYLDGKTIFRNAREGRPMKAKTLTSEGYSIQVNAAKVGFSYLDFAATFVPGREYTLVPMGDLTTTAPPTAMLIDRPSLIVPKFGAHIVFAVAMPDTVPVDLLLDGQPVVADVASGAYTEAFATSAGKHTIELQVDGVSIFGPQKVNLKKGQTTTLIATGTLDPSDKNKVDVEALPTKGL